ncbi:MAG TPA: hypothetical protein GX740_02995 [Acholeplasmataceae bacterium]|nr:hypothetical protein [Acholeplasmataceae bacterium]
MFKKNSARFAGQMNQPPFHDPFGGMMQGGMQPGMQTEGMIFPQVHEDRLQFEIRENRRRINNLTRRVIRLENYLRIRDTSDYVNIDDDHIPHEFSM